MNCLWYKFNNKFYLNLTLKQFEFYILILKYNRIKIYLN